MSNTRPSLAKRQTRATDKARQEAMDLGVSIVVDGKTYTVRQGEMTSQDVMHLRRETGFSFRGLMVSTSRDPDIDVIAALVWLARRQDGELMLSFDEVAAGIGYDVDVDLVDAGPSEPDPEG